MSKATETYTPKEKRQRITAWRKLWRKHNRVVAVLGCVVALATSFALMLPVISFTQEAAEEVGVVMGVQADENNQASEDATAGVADQMVSIEGASQEISTMAVSSGDSQDGHEEAISTQAVDEANGSADANDSAYQFTDDDADDADEQDDFADDADDDVNVSNAGTDASGSDDAVLEIPTQIFEAGLTDADDKVVLTVQAEVPEGALPADAFMKIDGVAADKVQDKVEETVRDTFGEKVTVTQLTAVDIVFRDAQGNEIEPSQDILVKITADCVRDYRNPVLVHVLDKTKESSKGKKVDAEIIKDVKVVNEDEDNKTVGTENTMKFEAAAFSPYVIADVAAADANDVEAVTDATGADANDVIAAEPDISEGFITTGDDDADADADADDSSMPARSFKDELIDEDGNPTLTIEIVAPAGALPKDATMVITPVEPQNVESAIEDAIAGKTDGKVSSIQAVDISFRDADGNEIEPAKKITVSLASNAIAQADDPLVVHVDDKGKANVVGTLDADALQEHGRKAVDNEVVFDSDEFSIYAVVGTVIKETVLASDGHNYKVTVTYKADSGIPRDADLAVEEILDDSEQYEGYVSKTESALGMEEGSAGHVRLFDIKIVDMDDPTVQYQPAEGTTVDVKIELADTDTSDFSVVHFDSGNDASVVDTETEGNAISFAADGFSVYAIVPGPSADTNWSKVTSLDDLISADPDNPTGFRIGHTSGYYFKNTITTKNGRTGIAKTAQNDTPDISGAAPYYFEKAPDGQYYIYCIVNNAKQYVYNGGNNSLSLKDASEKTAFTVEVNSSGVFSIHNGEWYVNMQGGAGGMGFCSWNSSSDTNNNLYIWKQSDSTGDPYGLDGLTYGLMTWTGGRTAKALMAKVNNGKDENDVPYSGCLEAKFLSVMTHENDASNKLYVPNDTADTVTHWTFEWLGSGSDHLYYLKADNGKYLKITSGGLQLADAPDDSCRVQVTLGTGQNKGQICLRSADSDSVPLTYSGKYAQGYNISGVSGSEWLHLVTPMQEDVLEQYEKVYTATKVSVSDTEKVNTGAQIIIYARQWKNDHYEYFAVNSKGELVPCSESGDTIEWYGGNLNDMLWQFTEYVWEGTDTPNGYYELENLYARGNSDPSYLAPKLSDGSILSPGTVGVNLQGRTNKQYYTPIVAWDQSAMKYSGLTVDLNHEDPVLEPCYRADGLDFYFAIMDEVPVDDEIHTVPTVDNDQYGIKVKMVDLTNGKTNQYGSNAFMNNFLGNKTSKGDTLQQTSGLLSPMLGSDGYPTVTGSTAGADWSPSHTNQSLAGLYGYNNSEQVVNHLFMESTYRATGYYEYNSAQNYAYLLKQGDSLVGTPSPDGGTYAVGDFVVYKELGTNDTTSKPSLQHGQFFPYNNIEPGRFASANPENLYDINKTLLPDSDPRKHEQLYLVKGDTDYYFAMEIEASFVQTPNGLDAWGHDIIFEFSGDDDFWLYVDDSLVIDLGGIHSAVSGSVNFRTGDVIVNGSHHTLRELFEANYRATHPSATGTEITNYLDKYFKPGETIFKDGTNHTMRAFYMERGAGASNLHMKFNLAAVKKGTVELSKKLEGVSDTETTYALFPYQVYYTMEGDPDTNPERKLRNSFGPEEVLLAEKLVTQEELNNHVYTEQELSDMYKTTDYYRLFGATETTDYVFYKDSTRPVTFLPEVKVDGVPYYNVFMLKPDETAVLNFPVAGEDPDHPITVDKYRIVECGINPDIYTEVTANDEPIAGVPNTSNPALSDYGVEPATTDDRARVDYVNKVKTLNNLQITKELYRKYDSATEPEKIELGEMNPGPQDEQKFNYRLYFKTPYDSAFAAANVYIYHIKDPDGYYCMWDEQMQKYVRITNAEAGYPNGTKDYNALTDDTTDAQGDVVHGDKFFSSFETGTNGSISEVPAYYTVEVRDLIPGTEYRLVERPSETADGFKFYQYENEDHLYTDTDPYDPSNGIDGTISSTPNTASEVDVRNYKGYGLRLEKAWEDATSIQDREPTYFAVYTVDQDGNPADLVPGSVQQLKYNSDPKKQQLYWWYLNLPFEDTGLKDYAVFEVKLGGEPSNFVVTDGFVTGYTGIIPVTDGGGIALNGKLNGQDEWKQIDYNVTYAEPEEIGNNVLKFKATNTPAKLPPVRIVKTKWDGSPLAGAVFTMKYGENPVLSLFDPEKKTSDANGLVAQVYLQEGITYTLKEESSPQGYVGLESSLQVGIEFTTSGWQLNVEPEIPSGYPEYYTVSETDGIITLAIKNHPYELQMVKVDSTDKQTTLAGAVFDLYKQVTVGSTTDWIEQKTGLTTGNNGVIPGIDNTLLPGTYQLRETTAPWMYGVLANVTFIVSDMGAITLGEHPDGVELTSTTDGSGKIIYSVAIANTPLPLKLKKVGESNQPLTGAKFRLTKKDETATSGNEDQNWLAVNSSTIPGYNGPDYSIIDMTSVSEIELSSLPKGLYRLEEAEAPSGYVITDKFSYFKIKPNREVWLCKADGTSESFEIGNAKLAYTQGVYTITVKNTPGVALPVTGGPGTAPLYVAGLLMIAASAIMFIRLYARRHSVSS